jgi:tetratricopeptide (TPR) repeat protein
LPWGPSFDPQSDPIVRIEAGRVRRALERYYLTAGSSDPVVIRIPKGSYVPSFSRRTEKKGLDPGVPKFAPPPEPSKAKGRLPTLSLALPAFAVFVFVVAAWAAFQWFAFPRKLESSSHGIHAHGPNLPKLLVEPFQNVTKTAEGAIIAIGLFFKNEIEAALKVGEKATDLNPNDTEFVGEYGVRLALSGQWTSGCPLVAQALERNPAPQGYYEVALALCSYMERDYKKALFWVRKADLQKNPLYHFLAAAIYGQIGDALASEQERQWILANAPGFLHDVHEELGMQIKMPRDQEHFLDGLKRAGFHLPES